MKKLQLVTTGTFGDLNCNFYKDAFDEILLTREQIGMALEYDNPTIALSKIHSRHKDRLDKLSVVTKLVSTDGKRYDTTLYNQRGIMEICRWSRQNKANEFMDWVWDIVENYRNDTLKTNENLLPILESINNRLIKLEESNKKPLPAKTYLWKTIAFAKLRQLTDYANENGYPDYELSKTMDTIYKIIQNTYNIMLIDYTNKFMREFGITKTPHTLDVIYHYTETRKMFDTIINDIMNKLELTKQETQTNIFDELIARKQNK